MRIKILLLACLMAISASAANKSVNIEPPYWWTGMAQDTLQLMVSAPEIGNYEAQVSYPGVKIIDQVRLENKDYLILYLTLAKDTRPGQMNLTFRDGKKNLKVPYQLKERNNKIKAQGFDASDVLYLVMPDRFAKAGKEPNLKSLTYTPKDDRSNPNARHGGNLAGLQKHLGYIDSLGVTAVWVNPVLTNDMEGGSYHGYATTDYYNIDPRFGTNEQWNALVDDAHSRGLKVVMDMIFNHTGINHPWNLNRPDKDWFNFNEGWKQTSYKLSPLHDPYASEYDKKLSTDGWFVADMPDLNQRNPHIAKYLTQNSIWWIESSGIDGIRMDTYPYADERAMAKWVQDVMREYPEFNIVGECWYTDEGAEAFWQRNSRVNSTNPELPTVMDFTIMQNAHEAFSTPTPTWGGGLNKMYEHLSLDFLFPEPDKILTFLDNHDTDRYLKEMPDSLEQWKQGIAFLLTTRGIPQIYYGTEILMNGTKARSDGDIRQDFPGGFPGDKTNAFTREGRTPLQNEAMDYLTTLLNFRKSSPALTGGKLKHFIPSQGVYVYERKAGDDRVVVIMNGNDEPVALDMEPFSEILTAGDIFTDLPTQEKVTITDTMNLSPRQTLILH